MPFEDITKKEYEELYSQLKNIDLTKVVEAEDTTELSAELACSGGVCTLE